jgi:hypothetical protein
MIKPPYSSRILVALALVLVVSVVFAILVFAMIVRDEARSILTFEVNRRGDTVEVTVEVEEVELDGGGRPLEGGPRPEVEVVLPLGA